MKNNDLIFGVHPVLEAIESGKQIDKLYFQRETKSEGLNQVRKAALNKGIIFQFVPAEKLNRLTKGQHQGVVALLCEIDYASIETLIPSVFEEGQTPFIIIADRITDVRNFGAICRTALCAGVDAIVIPAHGAAAISSDAMKASAGALNLLPVCKEVNLKDTLKYLKNSGLKIISVTEKGDKPYYEAELHGPIAMILGAEDDGVSGEYLKLSDEVITIPMSGKLDSLNVSVAAGIVMFEALRQRTTKV
jgi:23S rRNA (guanosine2251-2'-O)-methyltransferase